MKADLYTTHTLLKRFSERALLLLLLLRCLCRLRKGKSSTPLLFLL